MKLQRFVVLFAVVLALGVLGFLLRMTQSQDTDVDLHNARLEHLRAATQADAEFNAAIGRARLQLEAEPQGLDELRQRLDTAQKELSAAGFETLGAAVRDDARAVRAGLQQKLTLAPEHASQLRAFVDAFQALRRTGNQLLARNLPDALRQDVVTLMREMFGYAIPAAPANGARIDELVVKINAAANSSADGAQLAQLAELAAGVRRSKDRVQSLNDRLAGAVTPASFSGLKTRYEADYRARQSAANRYRLILAVYVGALLLAFGGLGLRLRSSFGALDRANAALRDTNLNLEKTVEQRTVDLRKALEDLRMQQAQLVQSEKMASLGQMVAGVAHEINTPLGYVRSNVGIVRESVDALTGLDGEVKAETLLLLADADHGLEQISELVMGLKNFSRMDRSLTEMFDVNEGLETALKICNNRIKGRIEVVREFGKVPAIPCAPSQLNQVFLNILTNASQAIADEGTITIRTREAADQVEVSIRDTGSGIDAETQKHIFEPFFTTKEIGQGTGLGLSIVFRIVQDHHGQINVKSAPGKGAEFILTLPKRRAAAAGAKIAAPNLSAVPSPA